MMDHNFLCNLLVLTLFGCLYKEAHSLNYDDLIAEIKGLRSIIDRMKETTDKQDIRIHKLTELIASKDNTVNSHDRVGFSRNKRGMYKAMYKPMYSMFHYSSIHTPGSTAYILLAYS